MTFVGKTFGPLALLALLAWTAAPHAAELPLDAPAHPRDPTTVFKAADSYQHALRVWKTPEDISAWIAANFTYDMARALELSETRRAAAGPAAIHTPAELFDTKAGICVDLARFAVEALRRIDPESAPRYVMIEFAPVELRGHVLRRHWLASFRRDGKIYFIADSRRPGHIAGPYDDLPQFIADYERYRSRPVVAARELDSYQKQRRARAVKQPAATRP